MRSPTKQSHCGDCEFRFRYPGQYGTHLVAACDPHNATSENTEDGHGDLLGGVKVSDVDHRPGMTVSHEHHAATMYTYHGFTMMTQEYRYVLVIVIDIYGCCSIIDWSGRSK